MAKQLLKSDDLKCCWVEAFKTGEVTDMAGTVHNFSEADLNDLNDGIQAQLAAGYQPPMVKGHPKVDDPRVGSIVDSKVDGNVLKVKIDDVNPDFADEVKKGSFKYVSSAIYKNLKKGLRHLGALGAYAPAMKGMAPICFGEGIFAESDKDVSEQDVCVFAESYSWDRLVPRSVFETVIYRLERLGSMFRSQREQIIEQKGIEEADKVFPEYAVKDIETIGDVLKDVDQWPTQAPAPAPVAESAFAETVSSVIPAGVKLEGCEAPAGTPDENTTGHPTVAVGDPKPEALSPDEPTTGGVEGNSEETERLREENAALIAENESLKADKLAAQRASAGAAFSEKLDSMIADGRMNVTMKASLEKVFKALQNVPVDGDGCFADGEESVNPFTVLDDALESMPRIVAFGEMDVNDKAPETSAEKITRYYESEVAKGRTISFAEAAEEAFK